jgi:hypothetical protein
MCCHNSLCFIHFNSLEFHSLQPPPVSFTLAIHQHVNPMLFRYRLLSLVYKGSRIKTRLTLHSNVHISISQSSKVFRHYDPNTLVTPPFSLFLPYFAAGFSFHNAIYSLSDLHCCA